MRAVRAYNDSFNHGQEKAGTEVWRGKTPPEP